MQRLQDITSWMESNHHAETTDYESKQKELENIFNPIMSRAYQGGNPDAGNSHQAPQGQQAGPRAD